MAQERFKVVPATHLFLMRGKEILLLRRYKTGWMDGSYSVPAGHIEGNETARVAIVREAKEEVSIALAQEDLKFAHIMHRYTNDRSNERVDFFFAAEKWQGDIKNGEPEKCDDLSWFNIDSLPKNMVPYVRAAIEKFRAGVPYSEFEFN
jgi:8-oxo-dGTP diphosphatase